jgi:hypothetical protein
MEIKPTYISFEQAKWLKGKGFDVKVDALYSGGIFFNTRNEAKEQLDWNKCVDETYSAPEQWQVVEFFRVKYNVFVEINPNWDNGNIDYYDATIYHNKIHDVLCGKKTPQEVYSAAFDYILKNLI